MLLDAKKIKSLKTAGRHRDGKNLYLQITPNGVKSWVFRYKVDGRERMLGLGPLNASDGTDYTITLADARDLAIDARRQLAAGIDPIEARRAKEDGDRKTRIENITFKEAVEEYLGLYQDEWKNQKHRAQWRSTLESYAFPKLGSRPVPAIDAAVINDCLSSIWKEVPETASRVKNRIEKVLKWVKDGKPLPTTTASRRAKPHPSLPFGELPGFLTELRKREGVSPKALEFLILTAARTGDVIGARWSEFDLKAKLWTIPAARMKAPRDHRVPLSERALEILKTAYTDGSDFVFIGGSKGTGLSNMAFLELVRGMNAERAKAGLPKYVDPKLDDREIVPHGFRSTFSTWASETTAYPNMVTEAALAHSIGDKTEAAYRRGDLFAKRVRLMRDWAAYCAMPSKANGANVVKLRRA
jgi:integrase